MKLIDRQYLVTPFYGSRKMAVWLGKQCRRASRERVQRLMRLMGLRAIYRRPRTTTPAKGHRRYPYLLKDLSITAPNQVWAADITYIPMERGFLYLVAIWTGTAGTCCPGDPATRWRRTSVWTRWRRRLARGGEPEIFNSDQGSQFTGDAFTPGCWIVKTSGPAWTGRGATATTCSSNDCGAR